MIPGLGKSSPGSALSGPSRQGPAQPIPAENSPTRFAGASLPENRSQAIGPFRRKINCLSHGERIPKYLIRECRTVLRTRQSGVNSHAFPRIH